MQEGHWDRPFKWCIRWVKQKLPFLGFKARYSWNEWSGHSQKTVVETPVLEVPSSNPMKVFGKNECCWSKRFFTQSMLNEPVLPQAAQLGIHFLQLLAQQTDAYSWGTWLKTLHWWRNVGKEREKKKKTKAQHPSGFEPTTSRILNLCVTNAALYFKTLKWDYKANFHFADGTYLWWWLLPNDLKDKFPILYQRPKNPIDISKWVSWGFLANSKKRKWNEWFVWLSRRTKKQKTKVAKVWQKWPKVRPKPTQNVAKMCNLDQKPKFANFLQAWWKFILAEFDRWLALDKFELERGKSLAKGWEVMKVELECQWVHPDIIISDWKNDGVWVT